jgi:hypothetical protein
MSMFRQGKFAHTILWPFAQRPSAFQVGRMAADLRFNDFHASKTAR